MIDAILWGAGITLGVIFTIFVLSFLTAILAAAFLYWDNRKNGGNK